MVSQTRLPFELDVRAEAAALTAHAGVPLLIEAFRTRGAAAVLEQVSIKRRKRGLTPAQPVEGPFSLWALAASAARTWRRCARTRRWRFCSGTACRHPPGPAAPARGRAPTARDFLDAFDEAAPPLWWGERAAVSGEGERLQGLAKAHRRLIGFLQERRPEATATLDIDATILESHKRLTTCDGRTGDQPMMALWA